MNRRLLLLALLTSALTPAVEAQLDSAYYGVSLGEFDYSTRAAGLGNEFDGSASSWRFMMGFQLTEHFALEGGYGETKTIRDTAAASPPSTAELGFETELHKIFTIRGLGTLPFDNGFSLLGGIGFFTYEQELALSVNGATLFGADVDPDGFGNLAFYLGAQKDWDRVAVRLSYEKWDFDSSAVLVFVGSDAQEVALSFFYKL